MLRTYDANRARARVCVCMACLRFDRIIHAARVEVIKYNAILQ